MIVGLKLVRDFQVFQRDRIVEARNAAVLKFNYSSDQNLVQK